MLLNVPDYQGPVSPMLLLLHLESIWCHWPWGLEGQRSIAIKLLDVFSLVLHIARLDHGAGCSHPHSNLDPILKAWASKAGELRSELLLCGPLPAWMNKLFEFPKPEFLCLPNAKGNNQRGKHRSGGQAGLHHKASALAQALWVQGQPLRMEPEFSFQPGTEQTKIAVEPDPEQVFRDNIYNYDLAQS